MKRAAWIILAATVVASCSSSSGRHTSALSTPKAEPVAITELPLPATISPSDTGITEGPGYAWDGHHVLLTVSFSDAATVNQVIAIKTDGTRFPSGDAWKCITCGVPDGNKLGASAALDHPQAFHDGKRILAGTNIIDCSPYRIVDNACTASAVHIHPIWWQVTADGSGKSGSMRSSR